MFRTSSFPSNKQNQTDRRFAAAATKIVARMFVVPLCLSFLNAASLTPLAAETLPNLTSYDFDGNGISDLLWRDPQTGDLAIWFMDGSAMPGKTYVSPISTRNGRLPVWGLDGDTKADLVWRNRQTGGVAVWLMDGSTVMAWSTLIGNRSRMADCRNRRPGWRR